MQTLQAELKQLMKEKITDLKQRID